MAGGVDWRTVSGRAGHADGHMTLSTYAHFQQAQDRKADDFYWELLSRATGEPSLALFSNDAAVILQVRSEGSGIDSLLTPKSRAKSWLKTSWARPLLGPPRCQLSGCLQHHGNPLCSSAPTCINHLREYQRSASASTGSLTSRSTGNSSRRASSNVGSVSVTALLRSVSRPW